LLNAAFAALYGATVPEGSFALRELMLMIVDPARPCM
jgi:hypothetical protein